jgi:enamine deaminase RidA (YjgF/YER057c/UK114 family)
MTNPPDAEVLLPDGWPRGQGYANGIAARGRTIFVAGQVGWNPVTSQFETDDFAAQVAQTFKNIVAVLHAGGAEPRHLVRLTWFITNKTAYVNARREIGEAYRAIIGRHFPTMSVVVVSALIEDRAHVEIEATAVIPE